MPVQILHVRIRDEHGRVVARRRAPFIVCGEDEDKDRLAHELRRLMRDIEHVLEDVIDEEDD